MEQIDLIQGTPEWHAHRASHFNASDAPAMLGISKYKTRQQLIAELATGITQDVDTATQRRFDEGHRIEALARPLAEKIIGKKLYPVVGFDGNLSASFDGLTADDSIVFEHKTLNDELRNTTRAEDLHEMYLAQIEQQMMLAGAEQTIFMATKWDGEELQETHYLMCAPNQDMRNRIIQGWAQFERDLEEYKLKLAAGEIEQPKPKLTGEAIMDLPALAVTATGMVTYSNLPEFKAAAEQYIASINTDLVTDQHFADAETTVKFCKATEEKLEVTKAAVLAQTASIDEVIRTVSHIQKQLADKRLMLDKLVKSEKEARKAAMVSAANVKYSEHVAGLQKEIAGVRLRLLLTTPSFAEAIKGKKLLSAMQEAIDTMMRDAMFAADKTASDVRSKLAWCKEHATGYSSLFPDLQNLVGYDMDAFTALITSRIEKAKAEEAAKLEAQRIRMEAEATAKAEREASIKIELERKESEAKLAAQESRIRVEEQDKARIAAAAITKAEYEAEQKRLEQAKAHSDMQEFADEIQNQEIIRNFLNSRDFGKDEARIRAILVEFIKFEANQKFCKIKVTA